MAQVRAGARRAGLTLVVCLLASLALAAGRPDAQVYEEAQKARATLSASPRRQAKRTEWESVVLKYRKVVARYPQSAYADDALLAVGDLYRSMATRFKNPQYRRDAVAAYRLVVSEYPSSRRGETALFAVYEIAGAGKDRQQLIAAGRQYLEAYPEGPHASSIKARVDRVVKPSEPKMPTPPPPGLADVFNLRFWSGESSTRVVLDVERQVEIQSDRIHDPERLWIDLRRTRLHPNLKDRSFPVGDGLLEQVRVGQNRDDVVRVVLDFKAVRDYSIVWLENPLRLVIDVRAPEPPPAPVILEASAVVPPPVVAPPPTTAPAPVPSAPETAAPSPTRAALEPNPVRARTPIATSVPIGGRPAVRPTPEPLPPVVADARPSPAPSKPPRPVKPKSEERKAAKAPPVVPSPEPPGGAEARKGKDQKGSRKADPPPVKAADAERPPVRISTRDTSPAPEDEPEPPSVMPTRKVTVATPPAPAPVAAPRRPANPTIPARSDSRPPQVAVAPKTPEPSPTLPPQANRSGGYSLARQLGLGARRIVIDAGHGGHDPGSIGPGGFEEKDLVLDVALRLADLVREGLGAEVVLTRSTDVFIPLEERTGIANAQRADLFLSIHANSSRSARARGVETYFLNFAKDAHAEDVAARENAISAATMKDLQNLVKAITLNSKIDESRDFAQSVHESMLGSVRSAVPAMPDRGVRTAPFYVLIGANMPSILAEVSFVSNPEEERLLRTREHRQRIAEGLYQGLSSYLSGINRTRPPVLTKSVAGSTVGKKDARRR